MTSTPTGPVICQSLLAALLFGCSVAQKQGSVVDLHHQSVDLFRAESPPLIVLIFTSTDCPVAHRYVPELLRLHSLFGSRGAAFYAVYVSPDESSETIARHAREFGYSFPVLRDPEQVLVRKAGATRVPEAALFRPSGELLYHGRIDNRYVRLGEERAVVTSHDLEEALEAALAGRPVRVKSQPPIGCSIPRSPTRE